MSVKALRRQLTKRPVTWSVVVGVFTTWIVLIVLGYIYEWEWVGVGEAYRPRPTDNEGIPQDIRREKTLWDWMQLLVIPIVIAAGTAAATFRLNQAAWRREKAAERRAQEGALQRQFHRDLLQAYSSAKKVRRLFRVKQQRGDLFARDRELPPALPLPSQKMVKQHAEPDDKLMEELLSITSQIEILEEEATTLFPGEAGRSIGDNMSKIEKYLTKILREYEGGSSSCFWTALWLEGGIPDKKGSERRLVTLYVL